MSLLGDIGRRVASGMGYGTSFSEEQYENIGRAVEEARKKGLSEEQMRIYLNLLRHEGSFLTDPGGNGGGIGQFLESTARGYGTSQAELRRNPGLAVKLALQLLLDNANSFDGDFAAGAASYFVGSSIIAEAKKRAGANGDWVAMADQVFKERYPQEFAKQGGPSSYLGRLGLVNDPRSQSGYYTGQGGAGGTGTKPVRQPNQAPDPNDYWYTDETGTYIFDDAAYQDARRAHLETQMLERELQTGPYADYMDQVMKEITAQISAGNLELSKAQTLLDTKMSTYKTFLDNLSSQSFGYGSPLGAEFVSGRGPDDYATKVLGLSPRSTAGSTIVNPLQEALATQNQSQSLVNAIRVPSVPSLAASLPGSSGPPPSSSGGGGTPGGGSPVPAPTPIPSGPTYNALGVPTTAAAISSAQAVAPNMPIDELAAWLAMNRGV